MSIRFATDPAKSKGFEKKSYLEVMRWLDNERLGMKAGFSSKAQLLVERESCSTEV